MDLKEIAEIAGYVVGGAAGIWLSALALKGALKRYTVWADKNKFYDKDVKFSDLENKGSSAFNQELTKMQYKRYANSVN